MPKLLPIQELTDKKEARKELKNLPTSPLNNGIMEVLEAGTDLKEYKDRKKAVNRNIKYSLLAKKDSRILNIVSAKSEVTIEIDDINKLAGSNKQAKKIFPLVLIKANEQAIHNGELTKDYITFPLQELITLGIYSTPRSAREGFKNAMSILTSFKAKGKIQKSPKNTAEIEALEVLFTGAKRENGQCTIYLNERVNWNVLTQYFTIIPAYCFSLPNKAADLLYYIFYLARQHYKDIAEKGYFTIGFRAIHARLNLPDEKKALNPKRDIKDIIETAIEKIEEAQHEYAGNSDFTMLPSYDDNASISDFLDHGYLKVMLKGEYAKRFFELNQSTNKRITEARRKQDRAEEKARIKMIENKLKSET